jgi:hypothetical protein
MTGDRGGGLLSRELSAPPRLDRAEEDASVPPEEVPVVGQKPASPREPSARFQSSAIAVMAGGISDMQ